MLGSNNGDSGPYALCIRTNPATLYYGYFDFPISSRDPWNFRKSTTNQALESPQIDKQAVVPTHCINHRLFILSRERSNVVGRVFSSSLPHFQALAPQPNYEKCDNSLSPALFPYKVTWPIFAPPAEASIYGTGGTRGHDPECPRRQFQRLTDGPPSARPLRILTSIVSKSTKPLSLDFECGECNREAQLVRYVPSVGLADQSVQHARNEGVPRPYRAVPPPNLLVSRAKKRVEY
ncbi:hypothetical protein CPAR01_08642 [Colletotrichum paranaense]|uniref:Uncharacterized protein n=1 Tax=Colletotrichum paranaense TaxID=1914294 RepID=A0ABQ9SL29_9PEZI|nr:uncharacterized protein CPAR01_08642 [Colletotrichum paranaense]KAK1538529.1 hypothetical protein CPAR01_08642 [Colletotrichum paranaense]